MDRAVRLAAALAFVACGGAPAPAPTAPAPVATAPAGGCATAYAEYEARWRVALTDDLHAIDAAMEPATIAEIVDEQVTTLPVRDDLVKLRAVYGVVELFIADAPWPVAFAAADAAIERCGEGAARPAG